MEFSKKSAGWGLPSSVQLGGSVGTIFSSINPATFTPGGTRGVRLANGHLGGRWFRGRIDEAAIYNQALTPGELLVVSQAQMGFRAADGEKIFLYTPGRVVVVDAVVVRTSPRARSPDGAGPWFYETALTFGTANRVALRDEVVINEIMYHHQPVFQDSAVAPAAPFAESAEEWVELFNRSRDTVDLSDWRFDEGIGFRFSNGTAISSGGFLVVAKDPAAMQTAYPGLAVVGPFTKQLSNGGEKIVLKDANNNPADEVRYFDGGRWPEFAGGGGPSLELRDPRADNSKGEAWAASDEGAKSSWRAYNYRGLAAASLGPDAQWREFMLGLLDEGEVLLDDLSVIEAPDGARVQMLQNTSFRSGLAGWRIIGNHHGKVVPDPDNPGNQVLHLVARGPTEHWSNHAETTLAGGRSVVNGRVYEISFRAKWMAGGPKLNTRLYFNRLPRTTLLEAPALNGTPGRPNSRLAANLGPTYDALRHTPNVPAPGEPVTISVTASDPDGLASMVLWWSANGGPWTNAPMTLHPSRFTLHEYTATIPGHPASTLVQFYISATATLGDDREGYRWNFIPHNNRERDDYSKIIALAKAFELTGPALDAATRDLMDVSQWMRTFAALSLCGVADAYTMGSPHNLWLYVRPTDGRVLALAHDWDVSFARSVTAPLTGDNGNLLKIINLPANHRVFYWHLRDLITNIWNPAYRGPWADHYDNFLPAQNFSGIVTYLTQRGNYVLSQLPLPVPFAITSNNGADFLTNRRSVSLRGSAPIDVQQIWLAGSSNPLALTWLNATNWQVTLPLVLGPTPFTFVALDYQSNAIATNRITVTTTATGGGQDTDGDGMPDAWELANGLSPTRPDANVDSDGDGLSNYQEFLAGTQPLQAQSSLKLAASGNARDSVKLSFFATAGRSYSLLHRDTLGGGSWNPWTNFSARLTNSVMEVSVPAGTAAQNFYRLVTPRNP